MGWNAGTTPPQGSLDTNEIPYRLARDYRDELVVARGETFPSAPIAEPPPLAKLERDKLRNTASAHKLSASLNSLPPVTAVKVQPQTRFPTEHPYKVRIGFLSNRPIWATLGKLSTPTRRAQTPCLCICTGHTDAELKNSGLFSDLGNVNMIEPFKSFWEQTASMVDKIANPMKVRGRWDERRGQFKSLVYWYLVNEAAERNGECYVPETVCRYFIHALRVLEDVGTRGKPQIGHAETRHIHFDENDTTKRQRHVENNMQERNVKQEIWEEVEKLETQEKSYADSVKKSLSELEARKRAPLMPQDEKYKSSHSEGHVSRGIGDTSKPSSLCDKSKSTENDPVATHRQHKRKRTAKDHKTASNNNISATDNFNTLSKRQKTTQYISEHHTDGHQVETYAKKKKQNTFRAPASDSVETGKRSAVSDVKIAIRKREDLINQEKQLKRQAQDLEKRYAEVIQQQEALRKLLEDNHRMVKGLVDEWKL